MVSEKAKNSRSGGGDGGGPQRRLALHPEWELPSTALRAAEGSGEGCWSQMPLVPRESDSGGIGMSSPVSPSQRDLRKNGSWPAPPGCGLIYHHRMALCR